MNAWRVVEVLNVLAEDSRYRLLAMLVQAGENGLPQGRLATRLGLSEARLRRHLAKLAEARLIRRNHRRRGVVWKAESRQLADLVETLTLRLKPTIEADASPSAVIDVPGGFRSLASKLASVTPPAPEPLRKAAFANGAPATTSLRHKARKRRLPARLSEALALRTG
jgi:DNA-binding transcriptional ArsR family regulator